MAYVFFFLEIITKIFVGQCIGVKGIVFCQVAGSIQIISKEIVLSTWEMTKWSVQD